MVQNKIKKRRWFSLFLPLTDGLSVRCCAPSPWWRSTETFSLCKYTEPSLQLFSGGTKPLLPPLVNQSAINWAGLVGCLGTHWLIRSKLQWDGWWSTMSSFTPPLYIMGVDCCFVWSNTWPHPFLLCPFLKITLWLSYLQNWFFFSQ